MVSTLWRGTGIHTFMGSIDPLHRMYSSTFSDWFSQAVIDFMLGNRTVVCLTFTLASDLTVLLVRLFRVPSETSIK